MPRRKKWVPTVKIAWLKNKQGSHIPLLVNQNDEVLVISEEEISSRHFKEQDDEWQLLLDKALQYISESARNAAEAKDNIHARRLSVAPTGKMVPVTPHTNKHKRVRQFRKDSVPSMGCLQDDSDEEASIAPEETDSTAKSVVVEESVKENSLLERISVASSHSESDSNNKKPVRKTRSTIKKKPPPVARARRTTRSSKSANLPDIQEVDVKTKGKRNSKKGNKKRVILNTPPKNNNDTTFDIEKAVEAQSSSSVGNDISVDEPAKCAEQEQPSSLSDNLSGSNFHRQTNHNQFAMEVRQLIAIHEAFIDDVVKDSCETPGQALPDDERNTDPSCPEKSGGRSMVEQVQSCIKKKPIVRVLKMSAASPEGRMMTPEVPITLQLDLVSSDEETQDDVSKEKECQDRNSTIVKKLDLGSSDEEVDGNAPEKNDCHNRKSTIVSTPIGTVSPDIVLPVRRSLNLQLSFSHEDSVAKDTSDPNDSQDNDSQRLENSDESMEDSLNIGSTDESQDDGSTVCSSSTATIILEDCLRSQENIGISREVRRSARIKKNNTDEISEAQTDRQNQHSTSKQPKIVKPIPKPNIVVQGIPKPPVITSAVMRNSKRALDQVESGSFLSPVRPKKFMKCASPLCSQKSKKTTTLRKRSRNTFLNRSTAASRSRRTPGLASPSIGSRTRAAIFSAATFKPVLSKSHLTPSRPGNLSTEIQSFLKRNTPQKTMTHKEQQAAKEEQLKEKEAREREVKRRKEEEKKKEALERKKKTNDKLRRAAKLRMQREKEESEKKAKMIEQWEKRVADADNVKVLRKKEEEAKGKIFKKRQMEAVEVVRKDEEERSKKLRELEQERVKRLEDQRLQKEQEAAAKKLAEQEKLQEKLRNEKLRDELEAEAAREREEQERVRKEAEEKAKLRKAEEATRLRQQRREKEELEKKRKLQEEIDRRNAEAAKLEQERIENEKEARRKQKEEAMRRQEEAIRRKEKETARKQKLEEIKAAQEMKARKRKEEDNTKAEELRKKREAMRKEAEIRREQEREAEKHRLEEERRRKQEQEREKMRKIQEANERLKKLQEEQQKEKALLKTMGQGSPCLNNTYNVSSYDMTPHLPKQFAPSTEDDYNIADISSGDSTDDDDHPRKTVPKWAKGGLLRSALIQQYYNPPSLNRIFGFILNEAMDLSAVFNTSKPRYNKRTSSAMWNSPIKDIGHVSISEYCRAQNC